MTDMQLPQAYRDIDVNVEMISPERAREWLKQQEERVGREEDAFVNRNLNEQNADGIAASIRNGEWYCTNQGIAFDTAGELVDGQHRLRGIYKANMAVPVIVVRGLSREAVAYIDSGMKRSESYRQSSTGVEGAEDINNSVVAMVNAMFAPYARNNLTTRQKAMFTVSIRDTTDLLCKHRVDKITIAPVRAAIALGHYRGQVSWEDMARFTDYICDPFSAEKKYNDARNCGAAISRLRDDLLSRTVHSREDKDNTMRRVQRALVAYSKGQSLTRINKVINEFAYPRIALDELKHL